MAADTLTGSFHLHGTDCKVVHSTLHTIGYYQFVNASVVAAFAAGGRDDPIAALYDIREMLKSGILEYGGDD